nr:hypothetical protein [Tanacetum cinerariifolium]
MWETNSYKTHEDHMMLYEALEKSMNRDHTDELLKDLAKARKKKKKRRDSSKTPPRSPPHQPPPPPQPAGPSRTSRSPEAFGSSQVAASSNPEDLHMDNDMDPDAQAHSSDDEDIGNAHIPKTSALVSTYSPPPEDSLLAQTSDMAIQQESRGEVRQSQGTHVSKAVDEIITNAVDWAIQALPRNLFRDLLEADMKEILHQRMWETNSYKTHEDHMMLYEALEKSMNRDHTDELLKDLAKARKKKKKRRDSLKMPLVS